MNRRILIVDDEPSLRQAYGDLLNPPAPPAILSSRGSGALAVAPTPIPRYELAYAASGAEALKLLHEARANHTPFAGCFCDVKLGEGIDGIELARQAKTLDPHLLFVFVTAYQDRSHDEIARLLGGERGHAWDIVGKPFTPMVIIQKARNLVADWNQRQQTPPTPPVAQAPAVELEMVTEPESIAVIEEIPVIDDIPILEEIPVLHEAPVPEEIPLPETELAPIEIPVVMDGVAPVEISEPPVEAPAPPVHTLREADVQAERFNVLSTVARGLGMDMGQLLITVGRTVRETSSIPPETSKFLLDLVERQTLGVRNLQAMARLSSRREATDVRPLLQRAMHMLSHDAQSVRVSVSLDLPPALPLVPASKPEFFQIFLNLMLNAIQAMPRGGALTVRAKLEKRDKGGMALEFTDQGEGVSSEIIERIFDPGFTTRPDKGSGLGLTASRRIAESHKGTLTVQSTLGRGSAFKVWIPLS
jgi:two-component system NtrC family sensor kinase